MRKEEIEGLFQRTVSDLEHGLGALSGGNHKDMLVGSSLWDDSLLGTGSGGRKRSPGTLREELFH